MRSSAARSRSYPIRCRRRARCCAASRSLTAPSLSSSIRPESSRRSGGPGAAMGTNAWTGVQDADIAAVLIDAARGLDDEADAILARIAETRQPKILLI